MKQLWVALVWAFAATCAASDDTSRAERPQDYARGVELAVEGQSPWYRLPLPEAVYSQSAWPDLRDIRVFNAQGASLPFALDTTTPPAPAPQRAPLTVYRLDAQPVKTSEEEQRTVLLTSPSGVQIRMENAPVEQLSASWLIPLGENNGERALTQLQLAWPQQVNGWQARVDVLASETMRDWQPIIADAPLLDLASGNQRLLQNTVDFSGAPSLFGAKYLLVVVKNASAPLDFTSATGLWQAPHVQARRVTLAAHGEKENDDAAVYRWARPQPFDALTLRPQLENAVVPVEIEYRSADNMAWQPLARTVIYRLPESPAVPLPLHGELISALRVRAVNQRFGDAFPEVTGERDEKTLVFNAQGSGPFLLAWGNGAAKTQALALQTLVPGSHDPEMLPYAQAVKAVTLGGDARLTAKDASAQRNARYTWIIWGVLVTGAAGLLLLAWRLWREIRGEKAA
ncbi:DUF3999 family protein [Cronobacter sakazakii]|uniref:DUF3999 domain-containing protein n=1 Tax=Cronobacter sakazakii TaxID=28141 RepID=A0AAN5X5N0_CROSK|nr:DUF3999 family protein [Cronobacter sakazakii]EGT4276485.1 DUF3999 domain-containing protein [Cronobacter sakazakii]EGT5693726.1 DUF3999 domain-containing protein [Cronobacter sakazakii]EGT5702232.1 DUF3999 domain-containing protein [Cronobacter sakazakii]EGT5717667.1 DUF3999 domain-containing protein [Cronobacter sakazakii]EGT5722790.1 DUF3999 domain-containing protein [Cronobacter sakazakii]